MKLKLGHLAGALAMVAGLHLLPASSVYATDHHPPPSWCRCRGSSATKWARSRCLPCLTSASSSMPPGWPSSPQSEWPQALAQAFKSDPGLKGVTAYAIRKGGTVVLVNAGRGVRQGDDLGQVAENLKAAGISPDEVSAVFLTNMHADQVGGLLGSDAQRQFKNAQLYASQEAMVHWLADHHYVQAPDAQKVSFATTITSVMPYVRSGKLQPVETGVSLVPGLSVLPLSAERRDRSAT